MKEYLKRLFRYIVRGIPVKNVRVEMTMLSNEELLKNRHIIVTGGGRGLGYYISKRLVELGATVLIVGRNKECLVNTSKELGPNCQYYAMDLNNCDEYEQLFDYALDKMGGYIDGLICNAGIWHDELSMLDVRLEDFEALFKTNVTSSYFLAQKFINIIDPERNNCLVFISSERAMQCDDLPYGLTKAAINSLTKGMSMRFGLSKNLRVNAVAPGTMATSMTGIDLTKSLYANDKKMERYYLPQEVAEVVSFLVSTASACISGEVIACDNGEYNSSYFKEKQL